MASVEPACDFVTCGEMFDVWTNLIGPHLSTRDLVALSMTSRWGYHTAHNIIKHTGYAKVTTPESCRHAAAHWPHVKFALELRSTQVQDAQIKMEEKMEMVAESAWCPVASLVVWGTQGTDFDFVDTTRLENLVVYGQGPTLPSNEHGSLARLLASAHSLVSLELINVIGDDAHWLADALQQMPKLTRLNLKANNLGPENIKVLVRALANMPQLTCLNLFENNLGPEGFLAVSPALQQMTNMADLNLGYNDLGPDTMKELAQVIVLMPRLTALDLFLNRIGTQGALHILPALSHMLELEQLNMSLNQLDAKLQSELRKAVPQAKELWAS